MPELLITACAIVAIGLAGLLAGGAEHLYREWRVTRRARLVRRRIACGIFSAHNRMSVRHSPRAHRKEDAA